MLHIGCHLSISQGFSGMGHQAVSIGADTFQFFLRNPRGGQAKDIQPEDVAGLRQIMQEHNFAPILVHASYTLNLAASEARVREFALQTMADDLQRLEQLPCHLYNFHPGSHVGQGAEKGIALISEGLNQVLKPEQTTTVLLETMAGKGSEVGRNFQELQQIIAGVELAEKVGVCLDTCHVNDAGYDLVDHLEETLAEFDKYIGLSRLKFIHLNDSLNGMGSHKDRHQTIGNGTLGLETFVQIIQHPLLRELPFVLETPNDLTGYAREIHLLQSLQN